MKKILENEFKDCEAEILETKDNLVKFNLIRTDMFDETYYAIVDNDKVKLIDEMRYKYGLDFYTK